MAAPACDPKKLAGDLDSVAWSKIFSLSTIIPLLGPSFAGQGWADATIGTWGTPAGAQSAARVSNQINDSIQTQQSQLRALTQQWQSTATRLLGEEINTIADLVATMPKYVDSSIGSALEPVAERAALQSVQLVCIAVILAFVVVYYV